MEFIWIVYICAVIIFIIIAIGAAKGVCKRKLLQKQTKYNFKSTKDNYTFYYSIKAFRSGERVKVKIITDSIIGLLDVAYYETNKFIGMDIFIDNNEMEKSLQVKGYKAMAEVIVPNAYIQDGHININFTIKTHWYFSKNLIEDVLTFQYEETL